MEQFDIIAIDNESITKRGLVYILVIEGNIFKIGQSVKCIRKRVQSYNYGKKEYCNNLPSSRTAEIVIMRSFYEKHNKIPIGCVNM